LPGKPQKKTIDATPAGQSENLKLPDRYPAWIITVVAFLFYYYSSEQTISWVHNSQDSGELATAAAVFGIPHPTGYPVYTLIGGLLIRLFSSTDPARVMVLVSVVSASLAVGLIARAGALLIVNLWKGGPITNNRAAWLGVLGAVFAFLNPVLWEQSGICEVYAPAVLLQAVGWFLLAKYLYYVDSGNERGSTVAVVSLGIIVGLIMAHHLVGLAFIIPVAVILLIRRPYKPLLSYGLGLISIIFGLLFYLYLPIASSHNPALDWSNPETLGNFIKHVTAAQYQHRFNPSQIDRWAWIQNIHITESGVLLALFFILAAYISIFFSGVNRSIKVLLCSDLILCVVVYVFSLGYGVKDAYVFLYPLIAVETLTVTIGIGIIVSLIDKLSRKLSLVLVIAMVFLILATLILSNQALLVGRRGFGPTGGAAAEFALREINRLPENSVVIVSSDGHFSALLYGSTCGIKLPDGRTLEPRKDLLILPKFWAYTEWYHENLVNWGVVKDPEKLEKVRRLPEKESIAEFIRVLDMDRPVYIDIGLDDDLNSFDELAVEKEDGRILHRVRVH